MPSSLRLLPLGGLGEFGKNCLALEQGPDIVVIDCGMAFPERGRGVDVIHPDFRWLEARRGSVRGLVVTHGHEDHIGGVPYLLRALQTQDTPSLPVYGPPYALELIRRRLDELGWNLEARLTPIHPRRSFALSSFEVEPIRVTHSIADAIALRIRTAVGDLIHTGDFKIDPHPSDGEDFDATRLSKLGTDGVRLLLSDSTNALSAGTSGDERSVEQALSDRVERAPYRVVVGIFASNVHRLGALFRIARKHGRHIGLLGRSVRRHCEVARETGYLPPSDALLIEPDRLAKQARDKVLIVATGTQGEAPAALGRLATRSHPGLALDRGDEVILSSRVIPGRERDTFAMVNRFERQGIRVHLADDAPEIHVSGHGYREEQRALIGMLQPQAFIPVHGTFRHLQAHAALATEMGITDSLVVENGALVEVSEQGMQVIDQVELEPVHVFAGEPVSAAVRRDRASLAERGFAVVTLGLDRAGSGPVALRLTTCGVWDHTVARDREAAASQRVLEAIARIPRQPTSSYSTRVCETAQRALQKHLRQTLGRAPVVRAEMLGAGS